MKRFRVLDSMKKGSIAERYIKLGASLEVELEKKAKDKHIIEKIIEDILNFLKIVEFAYSFLVADYDDIKTFKTSLSQVSLPRDLMQSQTLSDTNAFLYHLFSMHMDDELRKKLKHLSQVEIYRLDEALFTLRDQSHLSSIVMSVSALESRLHSVVKKKHPSLYKHDNMNRATLGVLLNQISTNKKYKKIKSALSEKSPALFTVCNNYRIFSAHPKEENMTYQEAYAILSFVVSFLLDTTKAEL